MADPPLDCIIVGAGLSGLTAATELIRAGYTCVVLEARDRVGGKTWSVNPDNLPYFVDVGAAWINDSNQSEVYSLSKELGLELVTQNTTGHVIQEDVNGELSTFEYGYAPEALSESGGLEEMLRIRQLFEDQCQQIDIHQLNTADLSLDSVSLQEWISSNSKSVTALASASVWTRAMLGLEPSEVSALHFLNYCKSGGGLLQMRKDTKGGGQYLRFVNGTQSLSSGLATRLPPGSLLLQHPVNNISQLTSDTQSCGLKVTTGANPPQTLCANHVIVTLPTPLYRTITFEPLLPDAKVSLASSTVQGYTNKVILLYTSPWWRRANLCGLLQSFVGPITVTRDSSVDQIGQYSLTCFLVGDFGRDLSRLTQQQRFASVIAHIERVFFPSCSTHGVSPEQPIAVTEYEWAKDPYSGGCPVPCMPTGVMSKYGQELRKPVGGIHFAGTETSFEWKGYMEGAIRSGKRAASEVIAVIGHSKKHGN